MKFITEQQIEQCCSMATAIDLMKDAFVALSAGRANVPLRTNLAVSDATRSLIMPVSMDGLETFGLKAVSLADLNPDKGLPRIHGTILLFDTSTGVPVCSLGAERITALRTGAAVGLATDLLAPMECDQAALFGTGNQASACIEAILQVRKIKRVFVYSRAPNKRKVFCESMTQKFELTFEPTDSLSPLRESQIVCLATSSAKPVFDSSHLPESFHLNAIGSYQKDQLEFSSSILKNTDVFVDQKSACLSEAGEIVEAVAKNELQENEILEIGKVANDPTFCTKRPRTVFKSVGNAVQDLVVANYVYQQLKA